MDTEGQKILQMRALIIYWGRTEVKNYPWRWVNDPYKVIVSEFMLHRTQVKQVIEIYTDFIKSYPSLENFSKASDIELIILKPLGLGWRIRGMIDALRYLYAEYQSVPVDYEKLLVVKGIGQYIAGATICFSVNQPVTLIDTNVVRVVGRVLGLNLKGEARRRKEVKEAITAVCDPDNPRDFYYSIIDFAHQICHPQFPECQICPLANIPCQFRLLAKNKE